LPIIAEWFTCAGGIMEAVEVGEGLLVEEALLCAGEQSKTHVAACK
jgi:hypothetical protein